MTIIKSKSTREEIRASIFEQAREQNELDEIEERRIEAFMRDPKNAHLLFDDDLEMFQNNDKR